MVRLVIYLVTIAIVAAGLSWLADRPGDLHIVWQGYDIETSVFHAVVLLAAAIAAIIFLLALLRALWNSPAIIGGRILRRRQQKGLDSLSGGLIAVGAGDGALATKFALQARKALPHEPLTQLLRARSAELIGDRATARRIYEAMLASPETEQLGLRGLFLEAEREGMSEAARQFASRALQANPKLGWPSNALLEQQCKQKDWEGALATLDAARKNGHIDKAAADRKRAVLLTAQASEAEDESPDKALTLAAEAHALAPDLVPAAAIAGRILASRGNTAKAAKVIQKTWAKSPHPELATVYAYARVGDSTRDRFDRVRQLAALNQHSIESQIAVATAAIEARLYDEARRALEPLLSGRLTQRVATLMARIEAAESGDKGRVREWLARAVNAARDPVWMADDVISEHWLPTSPDGRLDAFQWRVPVETRDATHKEILARRLDELIAIETRPSSAPERNEPQTVEAEPVTARPNGDMRTSATSGASRQGERRDPKTDTTIFVAPPAPDDPGTAPDEQTQDLPMAGRNVRASS
jgi:HemY protein